MHAEHREGADLAGALRAAEAAVAVELDYTIALVEKPLYIQPRVEVRGTHDTRDTEYVCRFAPHIGYCYGT